MGFFRQLFARLGLSEPGLGHVWWTNFLLSLSSAAAAIRFARLFGRIRGIAAGNQRRKDVEDLYTELGQVARNAGEDFTESSSHDLALEHFAIMPLLGVGPALIAFGKDEPVSRLVEVSGIDSVLEAIQLGKGAVLVSVHFGAPGTCVAVLRRRGLPGLVLRDEMFRRYLGTRHGRHYFLDTETLFIDENSTSGGGPELLRCTRFLKAGGVVTYVADSFSGARGSTQTIFGRSVQLKTGLLGAARICGSPVIPSFGYYENGMLKVTYLEPEFVRTPEDEDKVMSRVASMLESLMARCPENMIWTEYDRVLVKNPSQVAGAVRS